MGNEWNSVTVGDAFELVNGFAFKSKDFLDAGIPVIKIKNVKAGYFSEHEFSYVDPSFLENRKEKLAQKDDLLVSMSGNRHDGSPETWVGKVALFRKDEPYFINQRVGALRVRNPEKYDPRFMSYLLSSWRYQQMFISVATSSGGQANLSPSQILSAPVDCPDIQEQKKIAHILGTLDDKIELNRQINATLESMAQALFKSWFVDFDPVIDNALAAGNPIPDALQARAEKRKALHQQADGTGEASPLQPLSADIRALFPDSFFFDEEMGWVPEGWHTLTFSDLVEAKQGRYLSKGDMSEEQSDLFVYPVWGGNGILGYSKNKAYDNPVTLMTCRGSNCGLIRTTQTASWVSNNSFACKAKLGSEYFVYLYLLNDDFSDCVSGSAQPQITYTALKNKRMRHPVSKSLCDLFSKRVESFRQKSFVNDCNSSALAAIRDALLPRLLSGQIKLHEAERLAAEVL